MLRRIVSYLVVPLVLLFINGSGNSVAQVREKRAAGGETATREKMIVDRGSGAMDLDLSRLNGSSVGSSKLKTLRFEVRPNSFFTILVFNNVLRGPALGSMGLIPQNSVTLPASLKASLNQLVIEKMVWSEPFDIVVRDGLYLLQHSGTSIQL
jgi:hypothetical protein